MSEMVRQRGVIKKLSDGHNLMEVYRQLVADGKHDPKNDDVEEDGSVNWIYSDELEIINGCLFDISGAPVEYDSEDYVEEGEKLNDQFYKIHLYWYNGGDSPIDDVIANADREYEDKKTPPPSVTFEFKTKEDRDKWYGAYSNSGEQELYEYWNQDNEEVPKWKERLEN